MLSEGMGKAEEEGMVGGCGLPTPQLGLADKSMGNQLSIKSENSKWCTEIVSTILLSQEDFCH